MSGERFVVRHLNDLDSFEEDFVTTPVRIPLGVTSFGVNAYAAREPGQPIIEEHDELGAGAGGHEELYFVATGHAVFTVDGEELDAPVGTLVFVRDPASRRAARARESDTTVLVVGGAPGRPFEPSPWEAWLEALPYHQAGEYGPAVEIMRGALDRYPDNPNVLYNLACVESLAGQSRTAIEHLRRAVELDPRARQWAREDPDLDPVREKLGFL